MSNRQFAISQEAQVLIPEAQVLIPEAQEAQALNPEAQDAGSHPEDPCNVCGRLAEKVPEPHNICLCKIMFLALAFNPRKPSQATLDSWKQYQLVLIDSLNTYFPPVLEALFPGYRIDVDFRDLVAAISVSAASDGSSKKLPVSGRVMAKFMADDSPHASAASAASASTVPTQVQVKQVQQVLLLPPVHDSYYCNRRCDCHRRRNEMDPPLNCSRPEGCDCRC